MNRENRESTFKQSWWTTKQIRGHNENDMGNNTLGLERRQKVNMYCDNVYKNIKKEDFEGTDLIFKNVTILDCELEACEAYHVLCENNKVEGSYIVRSGMDIGFITNCEINKCILEESGISGIEITNCLYTDEQAKVFGFVIS